MVVGKIVSEIVRRSATSIVPKIFREFGKYDVRFHRGLFGKAGGAGFRHGRDAGLVIGGQARRSESGLDAPSSQPPYTSRKFNKTRRGYGNVRSRGRRRKYCYPRPSRR